MEWDFLMLKLGSMGFDLLAPLGNVTNYLQEMRSQNNLISHQFLYSIFEETLHKLVESTYFLRSPYFYISKCLFLFLFLCIFFLQPWLHSSNVSHPPIRVGYYS